MKKILVILVMVLGITSLSFTALYHQDKKPWPVPDKFAKVANPVPSDAASLKEGKEIWAKHCQSCHGKTGLGDGSKAAQLKTEAGNFSLPSTQKQSDGALYYKTAEGREDMPSFKKKIPDAEDIWKVVSYMRTFKK